MAAREKASGNGVSIQDLFATLQAAMLQRMKAVEEAVTELTRVVNTGAASLPREFMRREDCAAFHEGLDKRLAIWIDHFQTQIKNLQENKADKDTLTTGISTAKVAFGIFVWLVATVVSVIATAITVVAMIRSQGGG